MNVLRYAQPKKKNGEGEGEGEGEGKGEGAQCEDQCEGREEFPSPLFDRHACDMIDGSSEFDYMTHGVVPNNTILSTVLYLLS